MTDPQELANRIGANHRALEDALDSGDLDTAKTLAAEQHVNFTDGFRYLTEDQGAVLDWDAVAGNDGAAARGGGAKTL